MRQIASSGSAKAIWIDRDKILKSLRTVAQAAREKFPEIIDIRLFGSLAKNEETGLSDIDVFILAETSEENPLERIKPYFYFFSDRLKVSIDVIVARPEELSNFQEMLKGSFSLL